MLILEEPQVKRVKFMLTLEDLQVKRAKFAAAFQADPTNAYLKQQWAECCYELGLAYEKAQEYLDAVSCYQRRQMQAIQLPYVI